jgi:hypothetical protein
MTGHHCANLQRIIHLLKCLLGLLEETKYDGSREFAIIFLVVHFQNLLESHGIDAISKIRQGDRALLALSSLQSAFWLARHGIMVPHPVFDFSTCDIGHIGTIS